VVVALWAALGFLILGVAVLLAAVCLAGLWRQPKRDIVGALWPGMSGESRAAPRLLDHRERLIRGLTRSGSTLLMVAAALSVVWGLVQMLTL
jgi:hypothetical protein